MRNLLGQFAQFAEGLRSTFAVDPGVPFFERLQVFRVRRAHCFTSVIRLQVIALYANIDAVEDTMTLEQLSEMARQKKDNFLLARASMAEYDTLKRLAGEYIDAIAAWHKQRFPGKKFNKPSVGYLIRAL
jgi:hypothetical protein